MSQGAGGTSGGELDLSSGLPAEREGIVPEQPETPFWTENLLFTPYDPVADVGMWLHLGTMPEDWTLWEDRCFIALPGEQGLLSYWAHHRTAPERRPAGAILELECIEPFRRWRISCDGFALHTPFEELYRDRAREGLKVRFSLELDVECRSPVWDAEAAAAADGGSMEQQGWAKQHYEQLFEATGRLWVGGYGHPSAYAREEQEIPINSATGWRDHSRGPRGAGTGARWGGHVIAGCLYPESRRSWFLSRYWDPEGNITLSGGGVAGDDGVMHYARVSEAPRLREITAAGERLDFGLDWDGGKLEITGTTAKSFWTAMRKSLAPGVDLEPPALVYALNWGPCEWDGEVGQFYIERSDGFNPVTPALREG